MKYRILEPGEKIVTYPVNSKEGKSDEQLTTRGEWLPAAFSWNGEIVPDAIQFRRLIKE